MFNLKITKDYNPDEERRQRGIQVDTVPFILLTLLVFLLPIFFLPTGVATLLASKMFLIHIIVLLSLFIVVLLKLREQKIKIPFNLLSLSLVLIPFITIVSAIFSKNVALSFTGRDFGIDTVVSIISLFLLLLLTSIQFQEKSKVAYTYVAIFTSFLIVGILHVLYILIPGLPHFGNFTTNVATTLGKWNDISIFSAMIAMVAMVTLQLLRLEKVAKIVIYTALILSIVLMIFVNFSLAWYSLAVFTLILFVYVIVVKNKGNRSVIPFVPLMIFLISFLFIIAGDNIGNTVSNAFNINHFEVRPSWAATFDVVKGTMANRPVLGSGPGLFETEWLLYKPSSINASDFWNVDFRYSVGYIPSFLVTTGVLGILAWLFFFVMYLYTGFKAVFKRTENVISHYFLITSFISSVFLWVAMVFYLPSVSIVALNFVLTGIFLATAHKEGLLKTKVFSSEDDPKSGFVYITFLILILIGTMALLYSVTNKFVAEAYLRSASVELNQNGNTEVAEEKIRQALQLDQTDTYYRSLAELGSINISNILQDTETPQDLLVDQFRSALSRTVSNYQSAIDYDPLNYNNYVDLGNLYQALVRLNVSGSYEKALEMYEKAREINPKNPQIVLQMARLEFTRGQVDRARELVGESLAIKPNYTDAIFFLSQIEVSQGNIAQAIQTVESATIIRPNDATVFFQLGLLRYNDGQFQRAVPAFERAIIINPNFQNAKYFLGLSYERLGRTDDAIAQFRDLAELNPNNQEVLTILSNLETGSQPFEGEDVVSPEDREEPPLEDEESADEVEEVEN